MRLHAWSATIRNGFAILPDERPWIADYVAELMAFPAGRHDDQGKSHLTRMNAVLRAYVDTRRCAK
jgi:predicted phage terminase large subunit-like protein